MKSSLSLLPVLFLFSCATDPGSLPVPVEQAGNVVVSVNNALAADIYLDRTPTGLRSPAILENVPVGDHVVHVFLPEYGLDSATVTVTDGQSTSVPFTLTRVPTGVLDVGSSPSGASVYVNGVRFGYTPLTINGLPEGSYLVKLKKNSYAEIAETVEVQASSLSSVDPVLTWAGHMPVMEHFSNTSCVPCVEADVRIEEVLIDFGIKQCASISYHADYPSPDDPMYLAAKIENDARMDFYNIITVPAVAIDGHRPEFFTYDELEDSLRALIAERRLLGPSVLLDIRPNHEWGQSTIEGTVELEAVGSPDSDLELRIALIEREIVYAQPPGVNGQTRFIDVFRAYDPSHQGTSIALATGEKRSVPYGFARQSSWGRHLAVVAFLQRTSDQSIVQAAWTVYPE